MPANSGESATHITLSNIVVAIMDNHAMCHLVFEVIHHFPSFSLHDEAILSNLYVISTMWNYKDFDVLSIFDLLCFLSTIMEYNMLESIFMLISPTAVELRSIL